jgi:predicted 2-oxoglutarate/Fe(II)-dependent dioxygenase YbiX
MARFKHVVEGFFTPEECKGFIDFSEKQGYEESLIRTREGEVMNKEIRDNDRVIWDNPQIAEQIWEMVKDMLPADIDGYEPIGLNERFRFYRYKDGQQFKPHVDGSFKRSETEASKITLLIYLNEDFEGGNTTLVLEGEEIEPKEGMLFLFEHRIMHCGRPVTEGTKYVLRTDVMYKLKEAE